MTTKKFEPQTLEKTINFYLSEIEKETDLTERRKMAEYVLDRVEDKIIRLHSEPLSPQIEQTLSDISHLISSDGLTRMSKNIIHKLSPDDNANEVTTQKRYRDFLANIEKHRSDIERYQNNELFQQMYDLTLPLKKNFNIEISRTILIDFFKKNFENRYNVGSFKYKEILDKIINQDGEVIDLKKLDMNYVSNLERNFENKTARQFVNNAQTFLAVIKMMAPIGNEYVAEKKLKGFVDVIKLVNDDVLKFNHTTRIESVNRIADKAFHFARLYEGAYKMKNNDAELPASIVHKCNNSLEKIQNILNDIDSQNTSSFNNDLNKLHVDSESSSQKSTDSTKSINTTDTVQKYRDILHQERNEQDDPENINNLSKDGP